MAYPSHEASPGTSAIDARQFRSALGNFATGVTVVTACDGSGGYVGVTASSFNSVSLTPPLILWSLDKCARSRPAFEFEPHFIVHVLSTDQLALADRFARSSASKFHDLDFKPGIGGAPLLSMCAATFQCRKTLVYEGGDHLILIGEVLEFTESGDAALLFYRGQYSVSEPHPNLLRQKNTHAPSGFSGDHINYLLSRAGEILQGDFDALLNRENLRHSEWRILAALGNQEHSVGAGELSIIEGVASAELDIILARLNTHGWVVISRAADGANLYQLTSDGRSKLMLVQAAASAQEADVLGCFNSSETRQLKDMLKRMVAATPIHTSQPGR